MCAHTAELKRGRARSTSYVCCAQTKWLQRLLMPSSALRATYSSHWLAMRSHDATSAGGPATHQSITKYRRSTSAVRRATRLRRPTPSAYA